MTARDAQPPQPYSRDTVAYVREFVDKIGTAYSLSAAEREFVSSLTLCITPDDLAPLHAHLNWLARPDVAQAFELAASDLGKSLDSDGFLVVARLTDLLADRVPTAARKAVAWLRGRAAEYAGHALEAETIFEHARGLDPEWPPTLFALAAIANDRGDAERGLSLLTRAGVDQRDGLYQLLQTYRSGHVLELRRNDPCWCGSGHRLKHCHREAPDLPLPRRASWLFHKASMFAQEGPWREEFIELAIERSRHDSGPTAVFDAIGDVLVVSAMLFEGELLEEYIEDRGTLLPGDELELARTWLLCERSLWQVEDVAAGVGMTVRDVRRGGSLFVHEVLGTKDAYLGMLFSSLVLPVGEDRHGFFGGIEPVSLAQRDECIALLDGLPEPLDVVVFFTRRYAPPQLVTSTGEQLALCEAVLQIKGRAAIVGTFNQHFTKSGKGEWVAGTDGGHAAEGQSIGASIAVAGRLVTVNTMSQARLDMMLDKLTELGLDYDVVNTSSMDIAELAKMPPTPPLPEALVAGKAHTSRAPELDDLLNTYIRNYEQQWLDEHIPALDGFTPREAAADPTRRDDLIALLNSLPTGSPNAMDANRLRAALGL